MKKNIYGKKIRLEIEVEEKSEQFYGVISSLKVFIDSSYLDIYFVKN